MRQFKETGLVKSIASSEGRQAEVGGPKGMESTNAAATSTGGNAGAVPKGGFTICEKKANGTSGERAPGRGLNREGAELGISTLANV